MKEGNFMFKEINPLIIVPGIGQSKTVLYDENGKELRKVWPLDFDEKAMIDAIKVPAILSAIFRHDIGFSKRAGKELERQLDVLASLPDGTCKHNIKAVTYGDRSFGECYKDEQDHIRCMLPTKKFTDITGENGFFFFSYHSFGHINNIVEDLENYIQAIKKKTGCEKVNLMPLSLGGTVTTAYLKKYGDRKHVDKVISIVPAFDGSFLIRDIFEGRVDLKNYEDFFRIFLNEEATKSISKLTKLFPQKVIEGFIGSVINVLREVIFKNCSMMWGTIPSEDYERLSQKFISDEEHKVLKAMTDNAYEVRKDFVKFVEEQNKNGVKIYTLCGYNLNMIPIIESKNVSSDMIVHTKSASMGANITAIGKTLEENYVQKNTVCKDSSHNHISPDRTIDASCGALPESTWYFRNMEHESSAANDKVMTLVRKIMYGEIETVFDDENYPQFIS